MQPGPFSLNGGVSVGSRAAVVEVCAGHWEPSRLNLITDYRARRMHERGMSFRDIAAQTGTSLTRVRTSLREAKGGRMRREVRAEIRRAGGLHGWWRS